MRLSPTRLTGLFAPNLFGRGRTLVQSVAIANATKGSYDHCGDGIHRNFFKWVNHYFNLEGLPINAEPDQHKPSGRYGDNHAVPQ